MKLISCDECGLVYDQDKIEFPEMYEIDGELIPGNSEWSRSKETFVAIVNCSCGSAIQQEEK